MPTNLPACDPFRPLAVHATRRDRAAVYALMFVSAVLTLALASVSHTATFALTF